ncbi:hypothetical protein FRB99_008605 [Tulasnella sp. 403]|nr:hypothetical protein FRB99_008605 [Tulasnella sp. 403]
MQQDGLPPEALQIEKSDLSYDATALLGSGRFGTVYRATLRGVLWNTLEEVVAVKKLFYAFDETGLAHLKRDVRTWAALEHPNVLPFRGFCEEEGKVLLVSPRHPGGTLATYLQKESLAYARRIELGNVFVSTSGHPQLCDYGISTIVNKTSAAALTQTDESPRYQSPEVLINTSQPTDRSDVWSWSCLFLKVIRFSTHCFDVEPTHCTSQILTGKTPYASVDDVDLLAEHLRLDHALPAGVDTLDCPPRAQNIMGYCWQHDPRLRPPIREVLAILAGQAFRFAAVRDITVKLCESNVVDALVFSRDGHYIALVLNELVQVPWESERWTIMPSGYADYTIDEVLLELNAGLDLGSPFREIA